MLDPEAAAGILAIGASTGLVITGGSSASSRGATIARPSTFSEPTGRMIVVRVVLTLLGGREVWRDTTVVVCVSIIVL